MQNNFGFNHWRERFKRWTGFGDWPLQYKLIVLFLMIGILPSIALGLLVNWTVNRIVDEQMTANTLQLIGKVNQTLDNNMENLQNITYLIGFDPAVKRFLSGEFTEDSYWDSEGGDEAPHALLNEEKSERYEIQQLLQGFTTLYPEIAAILVVNHEGDYISNEMYARNDEALTNEGWYKEAAKHEGIFTVLGHPIERNVTTHVYYSNDELISVVRSFVDPDTREVTGAVLIDLKLRAVAGAVRGVTLGKDGYLMVTARDGKPIYTPDHSPIAGISPSWFPEEESGTFMRDVDGQPLQFMYVTSSFTGWKTLGVFGAGEAVHEVRKIQFYLICFLFVVCLFGLTASYTLSQSISRPIRQLMSFMQKAESGDLTIRYWGGGQDEVGMLGRSFNRMLLQIRKLMRLSEMKERQKREAELRSLQAHIKPHFLYNTLDTIHWMALKKGADDVSQMVESLSNLFRIGLSKGNDIIPIQDEWTHITSYMQIQKTRYRDRLNYELQLPPEAANLYVLKLLLQPIVENAIYHGIKARRGPGHITISARIEEHTLLLMVTDNGAGMSPERLKELRGLLQDPLSAMQEQAGWEERASRSYGLLNVQARIMLTFNEQYGIHIESSEGAGTSVVIRHPLLHTVPVAPTEQGE